MSKLADDTAWAANDHRPIPPNTAEYDTDQIARLIAELETLLQARHRREALLAEDLLQARHHRRTAA